MTVHELHPRTGIDPGAASEVRGWLDESDNLRYRAAQAMQAWYDAGSSQQEIAAAVMKTQSSVSRLMKALRGSLCLEEFLDRLSEVEHPTAPQPEDSAADPPVYAQAHEPEVPFGSGGLPWPEREMDSPPAPEPAPAPDEPTCDPYNHFEALASALLRFIQEHEGQAAWAAKPKHIKAIRARLKRAAKIMEDYPQ